MRKRLYERGSGRLVLAVLLVVIGVAVVTTAAFATSSRHSRSAEAGDASVVGSWHVTVNVDGSPTPFDALYLINRDGRLLPDRRTEQRSWPRQLAGEHGQPCRDHRRPVRVQRHGTARRHHHLEHAGVGSGRRPERNVQCNRSRPQRRPAARVPENRHLLRRADRRAGSVAVRIVLTRVPRLGSPEAPGTRRPLSTGTLH
jgi:hypothetical protein